MEADEQRQFDLLLHDYEQRSENQRVTTSTFVTLLAGFVALYGVIGFVLLKAGDPKPPATWIYLLLPALPLPGVGYGLQLWGESALRREYLANLERELHRRAKYPRVRGVPMPAYYQLAFLPWKKLHAAAFGASLIVFPISLAYVAGLAYAALIVEHKWGGWVALFLVYLMLGLITVFFFCRALKSEQIWRESRAKLRATTRGTPSPRTMLSVRLRRASGTDRLAVLLVLVGVALIVGWEFGYLKTWAPHGAIGALSIALTVAVVDRIVRRDARERQRPWIEFGNRSLARCVRALTEAVALDYAATHVTGYERPNGNVQGVFDRWLDTQSHADTDPSIRVLPDAIDRALDTVESIKDAPLAYSLDPTLIGALSEFARVARSVVPAARVSPPGARDDHFRSLVVEARALADAVIQFVPPRDLGDFEISSVSGNWTKFDDAHFIFIEAQARKPRSSPSA